MRAGTWLLGALALAGCPSVGPGEWESVQDRDGDGEPGERFGGEDCRDDDPDVTDCDLDGDGYLDVRFGGGDCADQDAALNPDTPWYRDGDGDGFGDEGAVTRQCLPPALHVAIAGDCDDGDVTVNPDADETCDEVDRDCTGDAFDVLDPPAYYVDRDGDTWGVPPVVGNGCEVPPGHVGFLGEPDCDDTAAQAHPGADEIWYDGVDGDCEGGDDDDQDGDGFAADFRGGDDCGDTDAEVFPGAPERCNGVDDDCDGLTDEDEYPEPVENSALHWPDADGDGSGDPLRAPVYRCLDVTHPGFSLFAGDCDDTRRTVSPLVGVERCNNLDDDCNGVADDNPRDAIEVWIDGDGDGWGGGDPVGACAEAPGLVGADRAGDCDDGDPAAFPGAPEVCGDGLRQDCRTDVAVDDCDADGASAPADCLDDPADPRAPAVHPGAPETCDGVDNDCDGLLDDEELTDPRTWPDWFVDFDGDGYGSGVVVVAQTCAPPPYAAPNDDDCDDARRGVFPGARETCDGRDEDCDGTVDDVDPDDAIAWYRDQDDDGYGAGSPTRACDAPAGRWSVLAGDCDDAAAAVSPEGVEACNAIDDDCDGAVDAADPSVVDRVYRDDDEDGAGRPDVSQGWCGQPPAGFAATGDDCDDGAADVGPDAPEVCNDRDDDCDGLDDLADPDTLLVPLFTDADGDGFTPSDVADASGCPGEPGYAEVASADADCADLDPTIAPDQPERCRPGDDDCDGLTEADAGEVVEEGLLDGFADADGDGWGDGEVRAVGCAVTTEAGDCDDADPAVHPNGLGGPFVLEVCNGRDDDCDGLGDNVDPLRSPLETGATVWVRDADGDGFADPATPRRGCTSAPAEIAYDDLRPDDCDDANPLRSPGLPELCDGVDNDCDTNVDEGAAGGALLWDDLDEDTFGVGAGAFRCPGPFTATRGGDCDDSTQAITTGDTYCADVDTDGFRADTGCAPACAQPADQLPLTAAIDCDDTNGGVTGVESGYADADLDGFGDALAPLLQCPAPGFTTDDTDCDDSDGGVFPGQVELCNLVDDDCDGTPDEGLVCGTAALYWPDLDADGFGDPAAVPSTTQFAGWVDNPLDCDDGANGDVVELGPYTTYNAFKNAWNAAVGAPCVLIELGADLTITDPLSVAPNEGRRLRATPGLDVTLTQGGFGGGFSSAGDLVVHDLDLALGTGAMSSFLHVTSTSSGELTVSNADLDLTGKSPAMAVIAGDASGTLRTAALTVHDGLTLTGPISQAGTVTHDLLVLRNLATGIADAGSTSATFRGPVFEDVAQVFSTLVFGGTTTLTMDDVTVTRSGFALPLPGSGDVTVRRGVFVDSSLRTTPQATGLVRVTIEDSTFDGGGLDIDGYGIELTVARTVVDGAPGHAIDVASFFEATVDVSDTEILSPTLSGIRFEPTNAFAVSGGTLQNVLVAGPGEYGLVGSGWTLENVTVVGATLAGIGKLGVEANPVVRDSIVWGSGTVDLGGSLNVARTLFQTQPAAAYTPLPGQPGFVRWNAAAAPATWDLRLHPVDACTDAEAASATGGHVGYAPQLATTDLDVDGLSDPWEVSWFGASTDPADDPDADGDDTATEYVSCTDPTTYP